MPSRLSYRLESLDVRRQGQYCFELGSCGARMSNWITGVLADPAVDRPGSSCPGVPDQALEYI